MTVVPNYRSHLVLEAHRIEGEGNRAMIVTRAFDILAFDVDSGFPVPMTLLGLPLPVDGSTYAIFNGENKCRTLLDGTFFREFRALADYLYAERDRAARWAAETGLGDANGSDSVADTGAPGKPLLGGAAAGVTPPARWK